MVAQLPLIVLIGPTASGKPALAIRLATLLAGRGQPAEIVNADAMQLYRGMDIGTAKLSVADRGTVPHHQLDVLEVTDLTLHRNIAVVELPASAWWHERSERLARVVPSA